MARCGMGAWHLVLPEIFRVRVITLNGHWLARHGKVRHGKVRHGKVGAWQGAAWQGGAWEVPAWQSAAWAVHAKLGTTSFLKI